MAKQSLWYGTLDFGNYELWVVDRTEQAVRDALIAELNHQNGIGPLTQEDIDYYNEECIYVCRIALGNVEWS